MIDLSARMRKYGRTSSVYFCAAGIVCLWTYGCIHARRQHVCTDSVDSPSPIVVFWQYPGYPLPGEQVRAGLVAAAWKDGRVVRVGEEGIGRQYITGTLSRNGIDRLHMLVAQNARFFEDNDVAKPVPDDVPFECMYISDSGTSAKRSFALSAPLHSFPRELRALLMTADLVGVTEARTDWSDLRSLCGSP